MRMDLKRMGRGEYRMNIGRNRKKRRR